MSPRDRRRQDVWDLVMAILFVIVLFANAMGVFGE
jgi:hypothetical protein